MLILYINLYDFDIKTLKTLDIVDILTQKFSRTQVKNYLNVVTPTEIFRGKKFTLLKQSRIVHRR
jgi:hypothetical protein